MKNWARPILGCVIETYTYCLTARQLPNWITHWYDGFTDVLLYKQWPVPLFQPIKNSWKNPPSSNELRKRTRPWLHKFYLMFSPPSRMVNCSPFSSPVTKFFRWATSSAFHSSSSVWWLNGSRFRRRLPENNTGSCKDDIHSKTESWKIALNMRNDLFGFFTPSTWPHFSLFSAFLDLLCYSSTHVI